MESAVMDGQAIADKVASWCQVTRPLVTVRNPQSVHLDDLVGSAYDPSAMLRVGLAALHSLATLLDADAAGIMPVLVVPLGSADALDVRVPPVSEYSIQIAEESAGLYLVMRDSKIFWESIEEYRVPLSDLVVPSARGGRYVSYYRCFRGSEALENDWEYERCVYVEYYCDALIL